MTRPDFSQVEVDREQVNLTRFSLFFPEKRDFFMEGEGTYTLGDVAERNYRTGPGPADSTIAPWAWTPTSASSTTSS